MSASGVISCNTRHNLGTGGDDNLPTSIGHGWQKGPRNSPTVLNAVFNKTATDEYVFRAAPLRNIALTAPYFYSGQVWDLRQAVSINGGGHLPHRWRLIRASRTRIGGVVFMNNR